MKIVYGERIGKDGEILVGCSATIFDETGQKVLLTRRADNHQEETGLNVEVQQLIGVYSNPNRIIQYADGNMFHLVALNFKVVVVGGELTTSDETTEFGYFSLQEIHNMDLLQTHAERIEDAFQQQSQVFIR